MSDQKSKLPDFKELTSMTSKLFNDLKTSVKEIIHDYKAKRQDVSEPEESAEKSTAKKAAEPKAEAHESEIQTSVDVEEKPEEKTKQKATSQKSDKSEE